MSVGADRPLGDLAVVVVSYNTREYLARREEVGRVYREIVGAHYPAMSAVEVRALIEDRAKVEIEATAVVPATAAPRQLSVC